jgi:hypothetical protein
MARGWESKAVESQQEEAARERTQTRALTTDQRVLAERRRTLELTRARTAADLSRATAPRHRTLLEHSLVAIDEQLAELEGR